MVFMPNFLNSLLNFGPSFGTHGSFTILSFLIVSIFIFFFFGSNVIHIFLVTFSITVILCTFSAKTFILFLEVNNFLNKCAVHVTKKYSHSYVWANVGMQFYLHVCNCRFTVYCKIIRMVYCYVHKVQILIIIFVLYGISAGLDYQENSKMQ